MLHVPQLDDMNYSNMFERARRMIPRLTPEWTDLNHHDPGITTMQMFYWLIDSLNYYLDATGEQHRLKYLKLLGIESKASPAICHVALSGENIHLPKGLKIYANDTVFETLKSFDGSENPVVSLYNVLDGVKKDLTRFAGVDGGYADIFTLENDINCSLYIGFKNQPTENTNLYIDIKDTNRNSFDKSFALCEYSWEYYNGVGFVPCSVLEDESCGFLKTGFIRLKLGDDAKKSRVNKMKEAYYIRCNILRNEFDVLPSIGRIFTACMPVVQTHTYADTHIIQYNGGDSIDLDFCIRANDIVTVAKKDGDSYIEWFNTDSNENLCLIKDGKTMNEKTIVFNNELPAEGDEFAVFVCERDMQEATILDTADGCAGQRMQIDADTDNLCELLLAFVSNKNNRMCYDIWQYSDDVTSESCDCKCFGLDRESGCIYFGDGINGLQPNQGDIAVLIRIKTSIFDRGNILENRIERAEEGYDYKLTNPEKAAGGQRRKNSDELEQEIAEKLNKVTRAVTAQDYEHIVLNTPGLMIDSLNVISAKEYCSAYNEQYYANTVVLAVKPRYGGRLPTLSDSYMKKIASNLKRYRLLTTEIKIVGVRYVGVSVYGRIALVENTEKTKNELKEFIASVVDRVREGEFGKKVDYGKLFSALELNHNVRSIGDLSLEYNGNGGFKNEQGDIVIHPDGLSYLKEIGLEFV